MEFADVPVAFGAGGGHSTPLGYAILAAVVVIMLIVWPLRRGRR